MPCAALHQDVALICSRLPNIGIIRQVNTNFRITQALCYCYMKPNNLHLAIWFTESDCSRKAICFEETSQQDDDCHGHLTSDNLSLYVHICIYELRHFCDNLPHENWTQCDYRMVHLPFIQDYSYLGLSHRKSIQVQGL